jgi:hypothetical protein
MTSEHFASFLVGLFLISAMIDWVGVVCWNLFISVVIKGYLRRFYPHLLIQISDLCYHLLVSVLSWFSKWDCTFFAGVCNIAHSSPGALHKTNFDSKDLPNGPHLSSHCGNVRPFFKLFEYVRSFISTMQHMLALCWSPSYSHMTFHCGRWMWWKG